MEGEWEFYDCPSHRLIAVEASTRTPAWGRHSEIDETSWRDFEERVRGRRVRALLAQAYQALETGDVILAQRAWYEARELAPKSPAVAQLAADIARQVPRSPAQIARRAAGAVALVALGISLLLGTESMRQLLPLDPRAVPATGVIARAELPSTPVTEGRPHAAHPPHLTPAMEDRPPAVPSDIPGDAPLAHSLTWNAGATRLARGDRNQRVAVPGGTALPAQPPTSIAQDRNSTGDIAPTTVAVAQRSAALSEPDSGVPGAAVAFLLSDAAARVAASSDATDAAMSLTQLATVLRGYAEASVQLNASAARRLWPSADEGELAAAFDRRRSRQISLDACDISVHGSTADASCTGNATLADGDETRPEARQWRFDLRRDGETWRIAHAETTPR